MLLVAAACTGQDQEPLPSNPPPSVSVTPTIMPAPLEGFTVTTVVLAGDELVVAVADRPSLRRQGLMGVTDLGDLDGMLFSYGEDVTSAFVMREVLIPLDLAFFDESGQFLGRIAMLPCEREPCRLYVPPAPFRWALEAPSGMLAPLRPGDVIEVG